MSSIVYPSQFDASRITISAPRSLQNGSKSAYFNYNREALTMQTAVSMSLPFGLNVDDKFGPTKYSINISFRGQEQRDDIKQFLDALTALDEKMIDEGVKNSKAWFKAEMSREVVKAFYTPCVKYSMGQDGKPAAYPPNLKVTLRKNGDDFETKFYDVHGSPYTGLPVEDMLAKGVQVTAIITCSSVWFAGSKFGLTWRAKQIAIHKLPEKIGEFAFKGLETAPALASVAAGNADEEDEEMEDDPAFRPSATAAVSSSGSVVASMMPSVQDDDGDDVEPIPAPQRTVIKKKIVARK
jgi:hypothetical protein